MFQPYFKTLDETRTLLIKNLLGGDTSSTILALLVFLRKQIPEISHIT